MPKIYLAKADPAFQAVLESLLSSLTATLSGDMFNHFSGCFLAFMQLQHDLAAPTRLRVAAALCHLLDGPDLLARLANIQAVRELRRVLCTAIVLSDRREAAGALAALFRRTSPPELPDLPAVPIAKGGGRYEHMFDTENLADVQLESIEGHTFFGHKFILCGSSEYFDKLLNGAMMEAGLPKVRSTPETKLFRVFAYFQFNTTGN